MRVLALIAGWYFGLLFLILAVAALFYSAATAAPLLLAAMLLLPPVRHRVHLITKRTLPRRARLINKGRIREGADADIVVLNAGRIIDRATFREPTPGS